MAEVQLKFSGWQAGLIAIALVGVLVVRLLSVGDDVQNKELHKELTLRLNSEYYPDLVDNMKAAMESGNQERLERVTDATLKSKLKIFSVQASYPLFEFKSDKDVVVKVTYSVVTPEGYFDGETKYYSFHHRGVGNIWRYKRESNAVFYYLNFM